MSIVVRVTDCAHGVAATDVNVELNHQDGPDWRTVTRGRTGEDGRLALWAEGPVEVGVYQVVFDLDGYFAMLGTTPLYPRAIIEFRVTDPQVDLNLPLMVTSNSYLTCREGA